ncbi:MAG: PASTA domain-containing protein [Gemmatimonadaceae bacterium]|jgi:hypothetical protein
MARKGRSGPSGTTFVIRLLTALLLGAGLGGAVGVAGVRRLEPGRPGQPDSLQSMLDSLRKQQAADPRTARRAADSADADRRARRTADSVALANDTTAPIIPEVAHLEEGAARNVLETGGLSIGTVEFKASTDLAGTVLGTVPAAGLRVRPGTSITLIVSNGRPPSETAPTPRTP